jgi:hypothetical protein
LHRRPTAFAAALRSNRALTASDVAKHGIRVPRRWTRHRRGAKPRAPASQRKSGRKTGEAPLEPFLHSTCVKRRRSFSQPNLPLGTGKRRHSHLGGEVSSPSLPGKGSATTIALDWIVDVSLLGRTDPGAATKSILSTNCLQLYASSPQRVTSLADDWHGDCNRRDNTTPT